MIRLMMFNMARPIVTTLLYVVGGMALYAYFTGKDMNLVVGGLLDSLVPVVEPIKAAVLDTLSNLGKERIG